MSLATERCEFAMKVTGESDWAVGGGKYQAALSFMSSEAAAAGGLA